MITQEMIRDFKAAVCCAEKAEATVQKYGKEIELLQSFCGKEELTKEELLRYREELIKKNQAVTVNGKLSAINSFLEFCEKGDLKLKYLKVQRKAFREEKRELSQKEYQRLLSAAKEGENMRLYLLMMTLAGTGIRVSELKFITAEAVSAGRAQISLKGKNREILLPGKLRKHLKSYAKKRGIKKGNVI